MKTGGGEISPGYGAQIAGGRAGPRCSGGSAEVVSECFFAQ